MKAKRILGFAIVSLTILSVLHISEVKANPKEDTGIIAETEETTENVTIEPTTEHIVAEPMETETETTFDYACIVIETTEDVVTIEYDGNLYDFFGDDYKVGDVVICTFTSEMEIIDAKKSETMEEIAFFNVPLSKEIQIHIFVECIRHNISPALVIAMIERESYYNVNLIGDNGDSFGLMQVQPKWHTPRMKHLGCTDLFNPYQNITVGIDYLVELRDEYGLTEICDVLMGYNGGPDYADDMISQGKISDYALRVSERASELSLEYYGE